MEPPVYSLNTLFAQLGLGNSDEEIDEFITSHCPIPEGKPIYEAPCWNRGQAELLKQSLEEDADWAEVVDQLDSRLRKS